MLDVETPSNPLLDAINESKGMLELEDDWDDDGSPGYEKSTWDRAVYFLLSNALRVLETHNIAILAPKVLPGPYGSIDLYWKTAHQMLLLNIPADKNEKTTYYGNNGRVIRGALDIFEDNQWLLVWLMEEGTEYV